jgi:hypothetical protein
MRVNHWVIRSNPVDLSDSSGTSGLDLITQCSFRWSRKKKRKSFMAFLLCVLYMTTSTLESCSQGVDLSIKTPDFELEFSRPIGQMTSEMRYSGSAQFSNLTSEY